MDHAASATSSAWHGSFCLFLLLCFQFSSGLLDGSTETSYDKIQKLLTKKYLETFEDGYLSEKFDTGIEKELNAEENDLRNGEVSDPLESKRWNNRNLVRVWGKRDFQLNIDEDEEKRARDNKNSLRVWGKLDGEEENELHLDEKRKWKDNKLKVWGKRDAAEENKEDEKRKWKDNKLKVWGKRDADEENKENEEKRKWTDKKLKAYGKQSAVENTKRDWNKNKVRVWGKRSATKPRSWRQSQVRVWGKRDSNGEDTGQIKRAWNQKMRVWGKRNSNYNYNSDVKISHQSKLNLINFLPEDVSSDADTELPADHRTLVSDDVKSPTNGKYGRTRRSWNSDPWSRVKLFSVIDGPKRSWRNNVIRVWGKRG